MFTHYALNREQMLHGRAVDDILEELMPHPMAEQCRGLLGVDLDTGCVLVQLTKSKQAHMKFGKYLRKVGFDLDVCRVYSSRLRAAVAIYNNVELKITEDGDEAYDVYWHGPNSCMSGMECTRSYSGPDVAVAYVKLNESIVARALVCINEDIGLQYSIIYGNDDLLRPLLEAAGYEDGSLEGCRIEKLTDCNGLIYTPWLDCGGSYDDYDGEYLIIAGYGTMSGQRECGTHGEVCDRCNETVGEDESQYSEWDEQQLCESCYDNQHVYIDGETYHVEDSDKIVEHDEDNRWMLTENATYISGLCGWYDDDECTWADWEEEYILKTDAVEAYTELGQKEPEVCHRDNCTEYNTDLGSVWFNDCVGEIEWIETRSEWIAKAATITCTYNGEVYHSEDVVLAITTMQNQLGEQCYEDDCEEINGHWVHNDLEGYHNQFMLEI